MSSLNKVQLIGRLGKDPEIVDLESGAKLAKFSLATGEKYKNQQGETVENTEWHNVILWRKTAEIAEKYLHKGDLIYIEGKLTTRSWEDDSGQKKYITEVVGFNLIMLGGKSDSNHNSAPNPQEQYAQAVAKANNTATDTSVVDDETDDLPF